MPSPDRALFIQHRSAPDEDGRTPCVKRSAQAIRRGDRRESPSYAIGKGAPSPLACPLRDPDPMGEIKQHEHRAADGGE
jgi:hypothetical protein